MEGLETTALTGLHGEKMMMVLNATRPGHKVPQHSHPHEQIGRVFKGKAALMIGREERVVKQGDFYCIPANMPHSDHALETSHLSCWTYSILCAKISFEKLRNTTT